jgi:hypothetical protein
MSQVGSVTPARIDEFMAWVDAAASNVGRSFFSYLIVKQPEGVALIKGTLIMNSMGDLFPHSNPTLSFENFTAGYLEIQGGKAAIIDFCSSLVTGGIEISGQQVRLIPSPGYSLTELRIDDPEGTLPNSVVRQPRCKLVGAMHLAPLGPATDWLLRAADPPYVSLQDLCVDYRLGTLSPSAMVDVIAYQVVWTDQSSEIKDGSLRLRIALMKGLDKSLCTVGYRMIGTTPPIRRGVFPPESFSWADEGELWMGTFETPVEPGDVVQCFATYGGRAQHQSLVIDQSRPQNPRRVIYEVHDPGMTTLRGWLKPPEEEQKGKQGAFEFAVQTLGWLLGFGAQHLDRVFGNTAAPDGLLICDRGAVVVECTIGPFGPDKLSKLLKRRSAVREKLAECGHPALPVECVIVSSLTADQAEIGRRSAAQHRIGFVARDDIDELLNKTFSLPNANEHFLELQRSIQQAQEVLDGGASPGAESITA